jgi:hypothetical protein
VIAPVNAQVLTTLEALKTELGLTGTDDDTFLTGEIPRASAAINNACGRRLIAQDYSELFRLPTTAFSGSGPAATGTDVLRLGQYPVSNVAIVENGTALAADTDYEVDAAAGMAWRLLNDCRVRWCGPKIVVAYTGGYASGDPLHAHDLGVLERAAIDAIKVNYFARTRDPSLRSENVLSGLYSYSLFDPSTPEGSGPYADVERALMPYRKLDR